MALSLTQNPTKTYKFLEIVYDPIKNTSINEHNDDNLTMDIIEQV